MDNKHKIITYTLIILLIVGGFVFWKTYYYPNNTFTPASKNNNQDNSSTPNVSPNASKSESTQPTQSSQPSNPATCSISGLINFISPTTAEDGAKLIYSGINSTAGQIYWTISPNEKEMQIGPNLAASLKLPDGESQVDVTLPQNPISKTYSLKTAMTYNRVTNGITKVYTANCSGTITVNLNY